MTNTRLSVVLQRGAAALWSSHAKPKKKNCNHQQQQPQQKKKKRLLFPVYLDERETEVLTAGDGQRETGRKNVNSRSHSLVHKDMDEFSPLLGNQPSGQPREGPDLLSPNLRPRHQELIPTPCGPIKRWSELSCLLKLYFCFTIASLLALLGLTISSVYKQHMDTEVTDEDNLPVSLIQLIGILFCIYYISRGVLQENRQELVAFVLSVLGVMVRSVVNFSVLGSKGKQDLLVRFVCIMCLGVIHVACTTLLIRRPNMMAFRVGGALESLQEQYFLLNLCFSMVTFDLQAQLCLCILITTSDSAMSADNYIILGVGVFWACLTAAVGAVAVLKEAKALVWVFMVQNLPQVAFFVYLMYSVIKKWSEDSVYILEAAAVTSALISLLIKVGLFWGLIRLVQSFGQGLRERMSAPSK
ncbi:uncharacterized protein LOC115584337 [Sparus aurata]|uniref:Uncharacterized LOC115584337 n=1 Tax=Sparus aurata TaxID=8175 RepID=A0A671UCV7_SPAAU|nr:uncharacterized protein LOC115584337 [Sparus aurata]